MNSKEVTVHIAGLPGAIADWPGLAVQTFGLEEIIFRTKGIPTLFTHWWHFVRSGRGVRGIVTSYPILSLKALDAKVTFYKRVVSLSRSSSPST